MISKITLFIGLITCLVAYYLEMNQVTGFSIVLVYTGSFILLLGLFLWLVNYKKRNGRLPRPLIDLDNRKDENINSANKHFAIMGYLIDHLPHLIIGTFLFVHVITLSTSIIHKRSTEYKVSIDYLNTDEEIINSIDKIKRTGFLISKQNFQNGNCKLRFNVIGDSRIIDTRLFINRTNQMFQVDSIHFN